jgi:hypothetical protein
MTEFKIDSSRVDSFLETLEEGTVTRDMIWKALHEGAIVLRENARNYFKSSCSSIANHVGKWYNFPMYEGITLIKEDKDYLETGVHIMKDHRLRWLEKGTNPRKTGQITGYSYDKKHRFRSGGHSTGQMTGKFFFKSAVQASEGEVQEAIFRSLDESLKNLEQGT